MSAPLNSSELLALLEAGQMLVLPTARAAGWLRSAFNRRQRDLGKAVWEPAAVHAWDSWMSSLWTTLIVEGVEERLLLNRVQEEALWAEIIEAAPDSRELSGHVSRGLAQLARSGFSLAAAYNALDRVRSGADGFDARTFSTWADSFREHCARHRFLPASLLEHTLARHLQSGSLRPPQTMHLAGFEQQTPAQVELIAAVRAAGGVVQAHVLQQSGPEPGPRIFSAPPNAREELRLAARLLIEHVKTTSEAAPSVAVIVPDPPGLRPELERTFRELLAPELEAVGTDLSSKPWQFATEPPLPTAPVIAHALALLRWTVGPLPLEQAGQLLLSPFFDLGDPLEVRARFEAHLLRRSLLLRPEIDLAGFSELAGRQHRNAGQPVAIFAPLHALARLLDQKGFRRALRSHAEWSDLVREFLAMVGWPGPRTQSPSEFRAAETWESLLDLLATLDFNGRRVGLPAFLSQLEREASAVPAAATQAEAPIRILSLQEAQAAFFDAALVLGATDANLPPIERPHPLLGRRLQAALGMPGSDPAAAYARTRDALSALADRCKTTILLAPEADEAGSLRPTALAAQLGFRPVPASDLAPPAAEPEPIRELEVPDEAPLPPLPSSSVEGGARVLQLQAACGFQAFADLRLRAEPPETRGLGLDARETGNFLHLALETLWTDLHDSVTLRSLSDQERSRTIDRAVSVAFRKLWSKVDAEDPWTNAYVNVLQQRFATLLDRWLRFELDRGPFTVLAPEQKQEIAVGPLHLSIRPDRVDRVEGGFAFVDYKTSASLSTSDWLGERPDAPQLPLYVLLAEANEVRGLAFARLRPGRDMGWISLADQTGIFPGKGDNKIYELESHIEFWRNELDRLARAFADGEAFLNPKSHPDTCRHCGHRLLCRLDPVKLAQEETYG